MKVQLALFFAILPFLGIASGQKVVLQAFWWDFLNNNFPDQWADYLAELSPRLAEIGIDAVWIPPTIKNPGNWVGYAPFDHYDLGDKYQKGFTGTRLGNKDELLRMVAVMHANGLDVVQDVVLNHVTGAGSTAGAGGSDPTAWNDKWTNFRYVSFSSPADDESETDYLSRNGRFPKNWQNFHNNPGHDCTSGDICAGFWGPDSCYYEGAYGQSSNAIFNPQQKANYMRDQVREWMIWYKKQLGFDGYRLDAVKHFPAFATEDFLYNVQQSAGWASGGDGMFAVGEYVGGGSELDNWCDSVKNRAGTFDFGLRGSLYGIITGNGFHDMGSIPGSQQGNRLRTVPFVNNHDTFRPILDAQGNYNGWKTSDELAPHIDPYDGRLSAAYAVAFALDGSPTVFIEDLFDLGKLGNRFTHNPKSADELPVRSDIANIIWCHQNLRFKEGAYKVRHGSGDLLVIERSAKAIIAVTDSWTQWQTVSIVTDFPQGTVLKDHSGSSADTKTVGAGGSVEISAPPCNGQAPNGRRCYSIWGPATPPGFSRTSRRTTQEWELADDLGDSHPLSLQQGGQLPANSVEHRTAGRIFVEASQPVDYTVYLSSAGNGVTIELFKDSQVVHSKSGQANFNGSYLPDFTGWLTIKARNEVSTSPGQKIWILATYKPPADVNTNSYDTQSHSPGDWDLYYRMLTKRYKSTMKEMSEKYNVRARG